MCLVPRAASSMVRIVCAYSQGSALWANGDWTPLLEPRAAILRTIPQTIAFMNKLGSILIIGFLAIDLIVAIAFVVRGL